MLRILTYHRVAEPGENPCLDPTLISATPADFVKQMESLARHYQVVSVDDVLEALERRSTLPSRAVLITFDDGYRDFQDHAWPVLRRFGYPATLFVSTYYPTVSGSSFWWDRLYYAFTFTANTTLRDRLLGAGTENTEADRLRLLKHFQNHIKKLPHAKAIEQVEIITKYLDVARPRGQSILTWPELRSLSLQGVVLGAHTQTHPILTKLPPDRARAEIRNSQLDLAREIKNVRPIFCYPSGEHNNDVVRIVREEGFKLALTTLDGQNDLRVQDPLRLLRTNITCRTTPTVFKIRMWRWVSLLDRIRHGKRKIDSPAPLATSEEY